MRVRPDPRRGSGLSRGYLSRGFRGTGKRGSFSNASIFLSFKDTGRLCFIVVVLQILIWGSGASSAAPKRLKKGHYYENTFDMRFVMLLCVLVWRVTPRFLIFIHFLS